VLDWYRNTLISRLDSKIDGVIIVIQQRLHEGDLAGYLLETGEWTHLNLPAIAEENESILVGPDKHYHRKENEVLHPNKEPIEVLNKLKTEMGSSNSVCHDFHSDSKCADLNVGTTCEAGKGKMGFCISTGIFSGKPNCKCKLLSK